jgi:hypothetical protein
MYGKVKVFIYLMPKKKTLWTLWSRDFQIDNSTIRRANPEEQTLSKSGNKGDKVLCDCKRVYSVRANIFRG